MTSLVSDNSVTTQIQAKKNTSLGQKNKVCCMELLLGIVSFGMMEALIWLMYRGGCQVPEVYYFVVHVIIRSVRELGMHVRG